ncbi:MAG: efflux RND transporter periplasmic adaptor subunit [Xanthomonadaceae bacterium]|nr:efflux RND transporter periplasmic adaptor subunit [Xanthomonadaceae bacterium]
MRLRSLIPLLSMLVLAVAGCDRQPEQQAAPEQRRTLITTTVAELRPVQLIEHSIGVIEAIDAPTLTAEVAGQVTRVLVDVGATVRQGDLLALIDPQPYQLARSAAAADVQRLESVIEQQQRQVARYRELVKENFVSEAALEEAEAQLAALREQHKAALAQLRLAQRDLAQAEVRAPVAGLVDLRLVAAGDFVGRGSPMFRLVSLSTLQVRLPFPETVASRLQPGLPVQLSSPLTPEQQVEGVIRQLRPALSSGGRALEAIVEIPNPGGWRAGGSVRGSVVLADREGVLVPEASVVQRPAGTVVYEIVDGTARERRVETGVRRDGWVEIRDGLPAGAVVAVDGAGFLSDGAAVNVQDRRESR